MLLVLFSSHTSKIIRLQTTRYLYCFIDNKLDSRFLFLLFSISKYITSNSRNSKKEEKEKEENRFTYDDLLYLKISVMSFLSACAYDRDIMPDTYKAF
jgi:hypothetical protein